MQTVEASCDGSCEMIRATKSDLVDLTKQSELAQINAKGTSIGTKTLLLNGLESACRHTELDPAIAFGPPQPTLLQVGLLQLLGADMGVAHGHAVVSARSGELTHPRHDDVPEELWHLANLDLTKEGSSDPSLHQLGHQFGRACLKAGKFSRLQSTH